MFQKQIQILILGIFVLIFTACSDKPREVEISVNASANNKALTDAAVIIDGVNEGSTNAQGAFKKIIMRKYGSEIEISLDKTVEGHRIVPWSEKFTFNDESPDEFSFTPVVTMTPFIKIIAKDGPHLVNKAKVYVGKKKVGVTNDQGEFIYDLNSSEPTQLSLKVTKGGYETWRSKKSVKPGDQIETSISKQLIIHVTSLSEKFSDQVKVSGLEVFLDNNLIGKTDAKGNFKYVKRGVRGKKSKLIIKAPGYTPAKWETNVNLIGGYNIKRFFYPNKQPALRVGLYRFVANSAEDIGDIPFRYQSALAERLAETDGFKVVETNDVIESIKSSKLSLETITSKGWEESSLRKIVDVIVFGSVAKNLQGEFILETKFYAINGELAASQIVSAKSSGRIKRATKELVINLKEEFPIWGMVTAVDDGDYELNLGRDAFPINRNDEFVVFNPVLNKRGQITKYEEIGGVRVRVTKRESSFAVADNLKKKVQVQPLAKVIRQTHSSSGKHFITVLAKGGIEGNIVPLDAVNVYVNKKWIGTTNRQGKLKVPVRLNKDYELSLYRHGYAQVSKTIETATNAEMKEFELESYNSVFRVASNPSGATVFVDGAKIGATPMDDGKPVSRGFHTVRVSAGGDWRDFEEVVEFSNDSENWTDDRAITFHKDWLRKGDKAEQSGQWEQAISAYNNASKEHPDYAEARSRVAQIYLDEKRDPDTAIQQFELVTAIPEINELIYKQYSVTYTNLGHAYHEKANTMLNSNPKEAVQYLAKSVKSLKKAKKNMRFFPNASYDAAVHDTFYYLALSYQKLYQISKKQNLHREAELAWRDYLDFFPENLENDPNYQESKESADRYMEQLKVSN